MMQRHVLLLCCAVVASLAGCAAWKAAPATPGDRLIAALTGSFSSAAQAARDRDYAEVELHAVRIWPERRDGAWLYVEQATAAARGKPYRQRIYHIVPQGGEWISQVYLLPGNAQDYAGAWRMPQRFAAMRIADLQLREGCDVILKALPDGRFSGGTRGKACASELRGAVYATSEVTLDAQGMTSWDRGFDADGRLVWGAVKGPYRFDRLR
jgi:hypothetical protein